MNSQTPLHKVEGMGPAHSGTGHFWHERVTSVALIPLSLWFLYAMLNLRGLLLWGCFSRLRGATGFTGFLEGAL